MQKYINSSIFGRIDGIIHPITKSEKLRLSDDQVLVDIQPKMSSANQEDTAVVLIALQFISRKSYC